MHHPRHKMKKRFWPIFQMLIIPSTDQKIKTEVTFKLHVQLNAVNKTFCDVVYPRGVASSQLCAGAEAGKSSCHGDSGGALVATVDGYAYGYGIVSYGRACGKEHIPVVYTRVTSFLDWIEQNMD
ncbi:serine protease [Culex quinquefasciatus]|uniref:Serine protease n=1 Tax=Culex quinquefasciatus TaxID=7176 RepID=B0WKS4_CULQU|nr:serine protease [Culex quinquefasciatus]|eukprot:XP_001849308.1 serine protease [Culex quinquefasciatus]